MGLLIWIITGFVSWSLSTYLLSRVLLPVTFKVCASLDAVPNLSWAVPALKILIPHTPDYLLGFTFCLVLGMMSRVTVSRVAGFVIAAGGVSLYYHLMQLAGHVAYGGDAPGRNWIVIGMISLLIISPLAAVMGSFAGRAIGKRVLG